MPPAPMPMRISFLAALDPACPGCVVADVRMPGMSGLDLQRHLAAQRIDLPVIIITGHADVESFNVGKTGEHKERIQFVEKCGC